MLSWPRGRAVLAGFVGLAAASVLPVATVQLPPILDYPNHLARMHVLAALPGSADLARYYTPSWSPIPDLAMDAIVPALARLMPVVAAMRLFLAIVLIGTAAGCVALHKALWRRWSSWPLVAFLLLYNRILLWGFLNYLAGLMLVLWALAAWLWLGKRPIMRLVLGTLLATLIYLSHLAAFGVYALALLAYETGSRSGQASLGRRVLPALTTLLPASLLFLTSPTAGAGAGIAYGNPLRKFDLPVSIFDNYDRVFDGATFAVLLVGLIMGLAKGGVRLHPGLRWSLLALLVAFLLLPSRLLSASGIDHRLPIAIAFLVVAGIDWAAVTVHRRNVVTALLLVLFVVRLGVVERVWLGADRVYTALAPAFDRIEPGSRLAVAAPARATQAGGVPLLHFPTLAVLRRDAFVPTLFAERGQQPLVLTQGAAALAAEDEPSEVWRALAAGTAPRLAGFDALMIVDPPPSLDEKSLPGPVIFRDPRLILVGLAAGAKAGTP